MHPLAYLARRVLYAIAIVFMQGSRQWGLFLTIWATLAMLAFTLLENQWKDSLINKQHIMNEAVLFVLCSLAVYFTDSATSIESRLIIGKWFNCLFVLMMLANSLLVLSQILKYIRQVLKRRFAKKNRSRLAKEVLFQMKLINTILF